LTFPQRLVRSQCKCRCDKQHRLTLGTLAAQVAALRQELAVRASGFDPPKPVVRFELLGLDAGLLGAIRKAGCVTQPLLYY
jgi:hypothetical protein